MRRWASRTSSGVTGSVIARTSDRLRLDDVPPRLRVPRSVDHRRRDGRHRRRPVLAEQGAERPRHREARPLHHAALLALPVDERGAERVHALEPERRHRVLRLALDRVVEHPRARVGVDGRHVHEDPRPLLPRRRREGHDRVMIDGAERLARARLLDRRAEARERRVRRVERRERRGDGEVDRRLPQLEPLQREGPAPDRDHRLERVVVEQHPQELAAHEPAAAGDPARLHLHARDGRTPVAAGGRVRPWQRRHRSSGTSGP